MAAPTSFFYFDLASPLAYLAAEQVLHALPGPAEWRPVLERELGGGREPGRGSELGGGREPGGDGDNREQALRCESERDAFREDVARRAHALGLQPLRWPEPFPFDSAFAMRAATYAKSIGRVVPFAQAAFRQAYAGGRDLADPDNVLIAAAACEMHPSAVLRGAELRSVGSQLAEATSDAVRSSIKKIPAIVVDGVVFDGERAIEHAAEQMLAADGGRPR
ncbi:MAG TPA: DsbA family protein [Solirubrobacteraceae bacterium]